MSTNMHTRGFHSLTGFLIVIFLISCSTKVSFDANSMVPGAKGTVKVKKDRNDNYHINLEVINLARPKELAIPKDAYLVWMQTKEKDVTKLGQLKVSSSLFSKTVKGSLSGTAPKRPSRVFITAEDKANVDEPSNYVVLNTRDF
jgi:hypothetical protein